MLKALTTAAAGAGLMYLFDPDQGAERRAHLRDQCRGLTNKSQAEFDKAVRDLQNRAQGVLAELRAAVSQEPVGDDVLVERVRAKLGRYCSHPHAVRVACHDGAIQLSGPILAPEVEGLLDAVGSVRGVLEVESELEVHEQAGNVSALQGEGNVADQSCATSLGEWSPATKLLLAAGGGTLAAYTLARVSPGTLVLGAIGVGLCASLLDEGQSPAEPDSSEAEAGSAPPYTQQPADQMRGSGERTNEPRQPASPEPASNELL